MLPRLGRPPRRAAGKGPGAAPAPQRSPGSGDGGLRALAFHGDRAFDGVDLASSKLSERRFATEPKGAAAGLSAGLVGGAARRGAEAEAEEDAEAKGLLRLLTGVLRSRRSGVCTPRKLV